ncbi:transposase [Streptomyces sp. NPDC020807]|uniref:transposase n=1 Tax=Streptomyces sp. NPDC020807 TaxID=3155119 RepID=UPI0033FDD54E
MVVTPRSPLTRADDLAGPRPELLSLLGGHFARAEPRDRALAYVRALLADPTRGSAAEIAAQAGADSAWSTQRLLTRAVWDADRLRDSVRDHVVPLLGTSGPCLVLRRHETARAGTGAVAVAPASPSPAAQPPASPAPSRSVAASPAPPSPVSAFPASGPPRGPASGAAAPQAVSRVAGRDRHTQVAALLCYVSRDRGALIDRELHLPPSWVADPGRCARAGVPAERVRPRNMADLGREMLERALAGGVPVGAVFGGPDFADPRLRRWMCHLRLPFCVELPQLPHPSTAEADPVAPRGEAGREETWQLLGRGLGSVYGHPAPGFRLTLLARRLPSGQISRFLLHAPATTPDLPAARAMAAAGAAAALAVHEADTRAGLSSHQVRTWVAWYRHTTLAMTAAALRLERNRAAPTS